MKNLLVDNNVFFYKFDEKEMKTFKQYCAESSNVIIVPKRKVKEKKPVKFHIPYNASDYVPPAVALAKDDEESKNQKRVN